MTAKTWLGWAMISAPFIALAAIGYRDLGVGETALIFGGIVTLFAWVFVAISLMASRR
jgi:hypothetical protein